MALLLPCLSLGLRLLTNVSALFPIYIGRNNRNLIWYYCWTSFIIDISCFTLKRLALPSSWLANLFFVVEFLLVGYFLNNVLFKGKALIISRGVALFILCYFIRDVICKSVMKADMEGVAVSYIYFIILLLIAFAKTMREMEYTHIQENPLFSLYAGLFIYSCGVVAIFLFERVLIIQDKQLLGQLWLVLNVLNIVKHLFIGYYFLLSHPRK